jgi:hypothetical protein
VCLPAQCPQLCYGVESQLPGLSCMHGWCAWSNTEQHTVWSTLSAANSCLASRASLAAASSLPCRPATTTWISTMARVSQSACRMLRNGLCSGHLHPAPCVPPRPEMWTLKTNLQNQHPGSPWQRWIPVRLACSHSLGTSYYCSHNSAGTARQRSSWVATAAR